MQILVLFSNEVTQMTPVMDAQKQMACHVYSVTFAESFLPLLLPAEYSAEQEL